MILVMLKRRFEGAQWLGQIQINMLQLRGEHREGVGYEVSVK